MALQPGGKKVIRKYFSLSPSLLPRSAPRPPLPLLSPSLRESAPPRSKVRSAFGASQPFRCTAPRPWRRYPALLPPSVGAGRVRSVCLPLNGLPPHRRYFYTRLHPKRGVRLPRSRAPPGDRARRSVAAWTGYARVSTPKEAFSALWPLPRAFVTHSEVSR